MRRVFESTRRRFRLIVVVLFLMLVFSVPFGERGSVRADIDGVCVMYCDDPSPTYSTPGGGGYGGGGCAAYDPYAYENSYTRSVGDYHPSHANVVWDGQHWAPASGYEWVSNDPDDYRVQRIFGSSHPVHPNVIWDGEHWTPTSGYEWVSNDPDDYRVQPAYGSTHPSNPNAYWDGEAWKPASGYTWYSDDPNDFRTVGPNEPHPFYPNVIWTGEKWRPAAGYTWASSDGDDWSVVGPGDAHPEHSNVVWTGDSWSPAPGYEWANDTAGDYSVITAAEAAARNPVPVPVPVPAPEPLPGDSGLKIADVPSPSGYRSPQERQAQLDRMTDVQIDTELARIRVTLVRMQKDFENNVADLGHWLKEAEAAEFDALKDSFGMLIGGSFDEFEGLWDTYPRLKALAKEGWDIAGKIELTMKTAENKGDVLQQIEYMREIMLEIHKGLAEEGLEHLTEDGVRAVALGKFVIDYSYHMTRWGIARNQITAISDNLDKPNGALEAQKRIQILQEELIREQKRRREIGTSATGATTNG